jgi:hypothetical protein
VSFNLRNATSLSSAKAATKALPAADSGNQAARVAYASAGTAD